MARKLSTAALARASARRPWLTVGVWGAAIVASLAAVVLLLGGALTSEGDVTADTESNRAEAIVDERFPQAEDELSGEMVVVRAAGQSVDDAPFRAQVETLVRALEGAGASEITTYYESGNEALVSEDGDATLISLAAGDDVGDVVAAVDTVDARPGFDAAITGEEVLDADFDEVSQSDIQNGELRIGLPAALAVVLLVFGTVVAGLVPVLFALVSIVGALALTALLGQGYELSLFVVNMITSMGLALGIDYGLFVLSRFREERARGRDKLDAIEAAGATASRAVLFSGVTFVLAMAGILLVPDTIMRSLAAGAILVGLVSLLAALTLLPAVLSLLGDRVNALRLPVVGRIAAQAGQEGRIWGKIARVVMRRPAVSVVLAAGVLLAASFPVLDLATGSSGVSTMPDRLASKQGFVLLNEEFPGRTTEPAFVVVDGEVSSPRVQDAVGALEEGIETDPRLGTPALELHPDRDLALIRVPVAGDPHGEDAVAAVRDLREQTIPGAFAGVDAEALVAGETADEIDYSGVVTGWLPIVITFVLGLTFVLLTIAFRSIVLALEAIVFNLLSVGAAYGLLVLVFQKGFGADLLGFTQSDTIEAWVPLFLFSIVFGLSMDYQVLLLSRIRERFAETGSTTVAVTDAVGSTARIITGAALIIVAVFSGFAMGELVMFQQMGFGIAVALLIDATVIRCVLVPAGMRLLGRWNWYLPRRLHWLPDLGVGSASRTG